MAAINEWKENQNINFSIGSAALLACVMIMRVSSRIEQN